MIELPPCQTQPFTALAADLMDQIAELRKEIKALRAASPSEWQVPINQELKKGDYVLATKYEDGSPWDAWCVGYFDRYDNERYYVTDENEKQFRMSGFRRCQRITSEVGREILCRSDCDDRCPGEKIKNIWDLLPPNNHNRSGEG